MEICIVVIIAIFVLSFIWVCWKMDTAPEGIEIPGVGYFPTKKG